MFAIIFSLFADKKDRYSFFEEVMANYSVQLIQFYRQLVPPVVPKDFFVMHPQPNEQVMHTVILFLNKFYNDEKPRRLLLGINPGRFGAGITGINFTAPKQLKDHCGINHPWKNNTELSAEFIYEMIAAYGGTAAFYSDYFIGAVCPLGFIKGGKNINYYDDKKLQLAVLPFIVSSLKKLLTIGFKRDICFCIGGEKNFKFLSTLNEEYKFFQKIIPLAHPRFIMQYRRKNKKEFLKDWLIQLKQS